MIRLCTLEKDLPIQPKIDTLSTLFGTALVDNVSPQSEALPFLSKTSLSFSSANFRRRFCATEIGDRWNHIYECTSKAQAQVEPTTFRVKMAYSIIPLEMIVQMIVHIPLLLYCMLKSLVLLFVPKSCQYKKDLTGQTVLITGAGSGIGRLMAVEFSKYSTRLVLLDLNRSSLMDTEKLLQPNTCSFVYECDVSDRRRVYEVADIVKRDVGKVDILVNNAGIVSGKRLLDIPDDRIQKTLEVNSLAHFWTCKAFLPAMMESNKGHIVSIASLAGLFGLSGLTDYCASKFAAVGFMQALFMELEAQRLDGVKLTTICPTVISTGLFAGIKPPFNVNLKPEDVAQEVIEAVLEEKEIVLIPGWTSFLLLLMAMMPVRLMKSFARNVGLLSAMDEFKGREKVN